ncbi:uncharacterized protein LOC131891673 [Tigriopus californicus]|uniref:uncharacterized protein LOC131891673 n=1 Tax=Tigriopus californicus TaxID=6832 RepID=UPI0027DA63E0|nr:uncharacterized protein LOC131891673 [Tigriopus californicus]
MWRTLLLSASFLSAHGLTKHKLFDLMHVVIDTWSPERIMFGIQSLEMCNFHCLRSNNCTLFTFNASAKECKINKFNGSLMETIPSPESELVHLIKSDAKEIIGVFGQNPNRSYEYDPYGSQDAPISYIPFEPQGHNSEAHMFNYNGGIMKCGGTPNWNTQLRTCYFAYPGSWKWVEVAKMNKKCGRGGSGWLLGNPWIAGGSEGTSSHNKTIILKNGAWEFGPDLPIPGVHHSLVELSPSKVLVIGMSIFTGSNPMDSRSETYLYDAITKEWSIFAHLSSHRPCMSVGKVALNEVKSIVVGVGGGGKPGFPVTDEVNILDLHNRIWTKAPYPFPTPISYGKVIVIDQGKRLLHLGGSSLTGGPNPKVYEYVHNKPWKRLHDLPSKIVRFGVLSYKVY